MRRSALEEARILLRRRKFARVVTLLENKGDTFKEVFDYYLILGIACLYLGDTGSASDYFNRARGISMTNVQLLLGQAALYLRRGSTDRAVQYYLDVLSNDPANKTANAALDFIKDNGDYDTICNWVDSGRIQVFYPPLGVNPDWIMGSVCAGIIAALLFSVLVIFLPRALRQRNALSRAAQAGITIPAAAPAAGARRPSAPADAVYTLSDAQVADAYRQARDYFEKYRDNAARVELNRILRSNASAADKENAALLVSKLAEPTISGFKDKREYFSVAQVEADLPAFEGCYVIWDGTISNVQASAAQYGCDLLVGEHEKRTEGIVPLRFAAPPVPLPDEEKPVRVLGQVAGADGQLALDVLRVYQSPKGTLPPLEK